MTVTAPSQAMLRDPFLSELAWRGMLHQTTGDALATHLATSGRVAYAGFDPTSDSLTIGNYIPLKMLAHFQRAGHKPIAVLGGGTGLIGDPSGKSNERQLLTREQVQKNVDGQRRAFDRVLDFGARGAGTATSAVMVDNADWLCDLSYLGVLRDVGKHFSVNQMIARDSVKGRLESREQGISYTEFSYMLLQAYDFVHLYRTHKCTVQMGGADQWGNIVSGCDLIRRMEHGESHGVTAPLVTASDGSKIGKTEKGAIWLTADRTSPFAFHQYWLNTPDTDAVKYLKWFTFLSRERIEELERALNEKPQERQAQRVLANEMTELFHGTTVRAEAEAAGKAVFSGEVQGLSAETLAEVAHTITETPAEVAANGAVATLIGLLVHAKLVASNREAREHLQAGAININGWKPTQDCPLSDVTAHAVHGWLIMRRGKKTLVAAKVS